VAQAAGSAVTITLRANPDVEELRRLAAQAHPDAAGLIAASLAFAWQCAADPFAPLRSIPGTAWRPGRSTSSTYQRGRSGTATSRRRSASSRPVIGNPGTNGINPELEGPHLKLLGRVSDIDQQPVDFQAGPNLVAATSPRCR